MEAYILRVFGTQSEFLIPTSNRIINSGRSVIISCRWFFMLKWKLFDFSDFLSIIVKTFLDNRKSFQYLIKPKTQFPTSSAKTDLASFKWWSGVFLLFPKLQTGDLRGEKRILRCSKLSQSIYFACFLCDREEWFYSYCNYLRSMV